MVTFDEKLHPKHGLRLKFDYKPRAFQYLDFFKITTPLPPYKFMPLDLTFSNHDELYQFLYNRGIVYDEAEVECIKNNIKAEATIVDTRKIYDVEESIIRYLLSYKYYSINEVAEMLSLSRPTIYNMVNERALKAVRINNQLRINHLDLMEFINKDNC